jgi:hypothetical protein
MAGNPSLTLPSPCILQQYINGEDIDFSAYATNGKVNAYTIQKEVNGPKTQIRNSRWISFLHQPEVYKIGTQIISSSAYSGPIHIDLRRDRKTGKIFAIEANPRFWGSMVASLCDNVNFIDIGIRLIRDSAFKVHPKGSHKIWGDPALLILSFLRMKRGSVRHYRRQHLHTQYRIWFLRNAFKVITRFIPYDYKAIRF